MHFTKKSGIITASVAAVFLTLAIAVYCCRPKQYTITLSINGVPDEKGFAILTDHDITPLDTFLTWQNYAEYWAFVSYYMPLVQDHPELFGDSAMITEFYSAVENFLSETNFTQETFESIGVEADVCLNEIYLDTNTKIYDADSTGVVRFKAYPWQVKKLNAIVITSAELYSYLVTKRCPTSFAFDVAPLSEMEQDEIFPVGNEDNGTDSVIIDEEPDENLLTHDVIDLEME